MKNYAENYQCKTAAEAVEYAIAQFKGLKVGKPVGSLGWLYLNTLDEMERRANTYVLYQTSILAKGG